MSGFPRISSRPTVSTFFDPSRSRIRVNCIGDEILILSWLLLPTVRTAEVVSTDVARSTGSRSPLLFGGLIERSREMSRGGWIRNACSTSSPVGVGLEVGLSSFECVDACSSWIGTLGISSLRRLCEMPFSISSTTPPQGSYVDGITNRT